MWDGMMLVCLVCGYIGLWEGHQWRDPTDDERALILSSPIYTNAISDVIGARLNAQWDRDDMREILERNLQPIVENGVTCSLLVATILGELCRAGMHTHRSLTTGDHEE